MDKAVTTGAKFARQSDILRGVTAWTRRQITLPRDAKLGVWVARDGTRTALESLTHERREGAADDELPDRLDVGGERTICRKFFHAPSDERVRGLDGWRRAQRAMILEPLRRAEQ